MTPTRISAPEIHLRQAQVADVPQILSLIGELAEYEKLSHEAVADETMLAAQLFGARPAAEVVIAEVDGQPAGFALFFHNFSTFLGQRGLYLEDLFVRPQYRGLGLGRRLMVHLARQATERGCGRFEWSVLDWNEPAIRFYRSLGAVGLEEWTVQRLTGPALDALAAQQDRPGR
jgi:GNAT superfamily N-acetyltransferase